MSTVPAPEPPSSSAKRGEVRKLLAIVVLAFTPLVVHDWIAPRDREVSTRSVLTAIRLYRSHVSPKLPAMCRFQPSCSKYGLVSIEKHGVVVGGAKTAWRILRCNPFTKKGTIDPP